MHTDQQPYRRLHDDILEYQGDAMYDDVVRPWLRAADGERRWLDSVRTRRGDPIPSTETEELWRLYALSRVLQLLQLPLAPRAADPSWTVAAIGTGEYVHLAETLGLERVDHPGFHPFYHEVVTVDQLPDDDAPPRVEEAHWPALRLGPLLVSRAGCRVAAGPRHVRKDVAERSTLYWAYARNHRPVQDLSAGWGGNSQWRTSFRRDYAVDGRLHYNVDAKPARGGGAAVDDHLSAGERAELLRHRCFVTCTKPSDDRWPYDLTLTEDL
ncbi:MAG: hypothetical protein JWM27_3713 [Gemmatimonadetes bacterium]|nr:hypothetical protein [Gemmatimonadota bacterium]